MTFSSNFKSVVNNAGFDPLQGYDADVWVVDQGTGSFNLVGRFTSIQMVIRNATEPYMEYNQRFPRHLDGDIQIGWVMERGQLDARVFEQTFGLKTLGREIRVNRMPRFQITFQTKADELDGKGITAEAGSTGATNPSSETYLTRKSNGRLVLSMCKVDTFTMGSTAGRQVIANRWEGMAEGIEFIDDTIGFAGTSTAESVIKDAVTASTLTNPFPWDIVSL
jgi:hypothetical protein